MLTRPEVGESGEEPELSCTAVRNGKQYNLFAKQVGSFWKSETYTCIMIQSFCS